MTATMRLSVVCVVLLAIAVSADDIPFFKQKYAIPSNVVRFTLGERDPGDSLVAQETQTYFYSKPVIFREQLNYPKSGNGAIITCVEIIAVDQTLGDVRQAYVVDGGIGERKISIELEDLDTSYFSYQVNYYGKE